MSLMLINPKHRPKKRRSAAQRAATAKLVARNRGRKTNPSRRRKAHHVAHAVVRRRRNPIGLSRVHHKRRARRRNPIALGGIGELLMTGLKGAGGAIAVNAVTSFLPATMIVNGSITLYATRAALAIALGTFGKKHLGGTARAMAEGALTVNIMDMIKNYMGTTIVPGMTLGTASSGTVYPRSYMGEFLSGGAGNRPAQLPFGQAQHLDSELAGMSEYMS
jgi:hypothetical protein